jgi:hypothetical protein
MAATESRKLESSAQLRRQLAAERAQLQSAVESLRRSAHPGDAVRARLPLVVGAALAVAYVLGGGVGATIRLLSHRRRRQRTVLDLGPFALVDRR